MSTICNHFIDIHIALRARARLPNYQRELFVQLSCKNFIANLRDEITFFKRENAQSVISISSTFFEIGKTFNDFVRHRSRNTNFEIVARAFCLCTPKFVGRYFHLAKGVFLNAIFHNLWF